MAKHLPKTLTIAALILCGAHLAQAGGLRRESDNRILFRSPTGNLQCTFLPVGDFTYLLGDTGPEVACVRFDPDEAVVVLNGTRPAKAADDEFEWPEGVQILPYGKSVSMTGISCMSTKAGIDCTSRSGHGFHISRTDLAIR